MVSAVAAVGVAGVLAVPFAIWHNGQTGGADLPVSVASATADPGTRPSGSPLSSMYRADPGPGDCVGSNEGQQVARLASSCASRSPSCLRVPTS
jgi:hypothetical protein